MVCFMFWNGIQVLIIEKLFLEIFKCEIVFVGINVNFGVYYLFQNGFCFDINGLIS